MKVSPLVDRIGGKSANAWAVHQAAVSAKKAGRDVIFLAVGDSDLDTPAPVTDAAIAALRAGDTHYTNAAGRAEFRSLVAEQHQAETGQEVNEDNVIILGGAQGGLFTASLCLATVGDEVVTFEPMFATYEASIRASGANLIQVPLSPAEDFRPNMAALRGAIGPKTRAIFLANPNNPTGVVLTRQELESIAQIAIEHNLWVVSDEVYHALTYDAPHQSICSLPGMAERTITVNSLSKSFAMTGWRLGWLVAPKQLIPHFENLALCMLYGLPGFIQEAGIVALREAQQEVEPFRALFRRRRDVVCDRLNRVEGLKCLTPEAGMFALVDVSATGYSSNDFAWALFDETGVAVLDASAFGRSANGYIRVSFAISEEELAEACDRIAGFVAELDGKKRTA